MKNCGVRRCFPANPFRRWFGAWRSPGFGARGRDLLELERKRAEKGAAVAFLRSHEDVSFAITGIFPRRGVEGIWLLNRIRLFVPVAKKRTRKTLEKLTSF